MLAYLTFGLLCALLALLLYQYARMRKYLALLKMAESTIDDLIPKVSSPALDTKREKLLECVLTGNSMPYLGRSYTEDQISRLSTEEVNKLFDHYEAKLSVQMVKSLGRSIIRMYAMGACLVLGMSDQDSLSQDLETDPFLNSTLQRFTCELYYHFRSFLAPLSIGLITSKHYLSECNEDGGRTRDGNDSDRGRARSRELSELGGREATAI